ncbi:MAG TPA: PQQ-binding-like beta-propeller repeat protein [Longimicrobiales bacterium]|nr:PQQ-binding-like beta-propeller repeat protein [Longimicrobiales bacterium]
MNRSKPRRRAPAALVAVTLFGLAGCADEDSGSLQGARGGSIPAPAFPAVTDTVLAAGPGRDWPLTGGDLANRRFSPLDQIGTGNVDELVPAWIHSTGIEGALETTPVVVGNTLYATSAGGRVIALNAATGEELWTYDPEPEIVTLCCGATNGGVSAYGEMVYVVSPDARAIALDARTGRPAWERRLADPAAGYSATMAPLAVGGQVFVGVAGERYGIRGFLAALDARTGVERWRWFTVPDDSTGWWGAWTETEPFGTTLNRDLPGERADSFNTRWSWNVGGGGIATTPAYDAATNRLFVNVEAPAPLLDGSIRPGDNLYSGSIVALDARTGRVAWHAQYLPHDVWGLSGGSPPFLFERGGGTFVGFAGRTGWVYVFEARTGRPVLRSDNFVPQEGLFTAYPEEGGIRMAPGVNGGNAGAPVAYDPRSGTVYVGGVHQPMVYTSAAEPYRRGELWLGGTVRFAPGEDQWGTVTAIDLGDGSIRWQKRTPRPVHSGALATAGGLLFIGQGSGTFDAFAAGTGELLWQFPTGAGVHGGPVTYEVGGVQYVVVPSGGSFHFGTPTGDDLIAFALASRRPARNTSEYRTPDYTRGGPATTGEGGVRQAPAPRPAPGDTGAATAPGAASSAAPGASRPREPAAVRGASVDSAGTPR